MNAPIFLTYNPNSEIAERTALRLQTISNLYGFTVHLPYRPAAQNITTETKTRIQKSQFLVAFSLERLSAKMKADINFAIEKKIPIIIVSKKGDSSKIHIPTQVNAKEVFIDFDRPDEAQHQIAQFLSSLKKKTAPKKQDSGLGLAIVSVGLALLAAWALSEDEKK